MAPNDKTTSGDPPHTEDHDAAKAAQHPLDTAAGENAGPIEGRGAFGTGMWIGLITVVIVIIVFIVIF